MDRCYSLASATSSTPSRRGNKTFSKSRLVTIDNFHLSRLDVVQHANDGGCFTSKKGVIFDHCDVFFDARFEAVDSVLAS